MKLKLFLALFCLGLAVPPMRAQKPNQAGNVTLRTEEAAVPPPRFSRLQAVAEAFAPIPALTAACEQVAEAGAAGSIATMRSD